MIFDQVSVVFHTSTPFMFGKFYVLVLVCRTDIWSFSKGSEEVHNYVEKPKQEVFQTYPRKLELRICATLGDNPCLMHKIINFKVTMLHFVLSHNATCYTLSLISCIHVNITILYNIMCTLVATSIKLHSSNCIFRQTTCPKIIRDVHLWGQKHQTTTKATTQQPQLWMYVFHVCQPPKLCSFAI